MPPGSSRQPRCLNAEVVFREPALRWFLAVSRTSELRPEQNFSFAPANRLSPYSLPFLNAFDGLPIRFSSFASPGGKVLVILAFHAQARGTRAARVFG